RSGNPGNYTYTVRSPGLGGTYKYDDKPVISVSWGDAARFCNWLHNGQPTGAEDSTTTEDGAYTLNGDETAGVTRNSGAIWFIPNEDEWYKAAYHKNDGVTGNYWDYPTRTDTRPNNNPPSGDTGNSANCNNENSSFALTDAGAYKLSGSAY